MRKISDEQPPSADLPLKEWLVRLARGANLAFDSMANPDLAQIEFLEGSDLTTQAIASTDTAVTVKFGSEVKGYYAVIAATGVVTFQHSGLFNVVASMSLKKGAGGGSTEYVVYYELDGVKSKSYLFSLNNPKNQTITIVDKIKAQVTSTLTFFVVADSNGNNDASLITYTPTLAGLNKVPSASIKIVRNV